MSDCKRHRHEFTALWWNFGSYGAQDVHVHSCFDEDCKRVLIGRGRSCNPSAKHHRYTLSANVPYKSSAL
jgi:hypothetical protein